MPQPKAHSVTSTGELDGWTPPRCFRREVISDGRTRLVISVPPEELQPLHARLLTALGPRIGLLYVQLTDRKSGAQHPTPLRRVAVELDAERALAAVTTRPQLIYEDARHQLWAKGTMGDQVVIDEMGLLYCYPDDPSFRDALGDLPMRTDPTLDTRDYIKVNFVAAADDQEATLWTDLGMVPWK
jgi:hypothetical protein